MWSLALSLRSFGSHVEEVRNDRNVSRPVREPPSLGKAITRERYGY